MADDYSSMNDSLSSRYKHLLWPAYAALVAALAAVFFADLRHLLLGVDDAGTFRDHIAISEDFFYFFSPDKERASGRVIDEFALWIGYLVWGNAPAFFHVLVAAVHALASFSLACAFHRLGADLKTSLVGGLLFLVNIAHIEVVHWISALEYPLAVFNVSWTLYLYARLSERPRRTLLWAFYGGLIVCVLTHFVTVLLWPFCFFWSWQRGEAWPRLARRLVPALPMLALALIFVFRITGSDTTTQLAFDSYNESMAATTAPAALLSLLADNTRALLWLLGRLVSMAHWLPLAPREQLGIEVWLGGAFLVALLALLWKGGRDIRLWSAWTLLFVAPFVPATLVHTGISRYLYLATAGSSFVLAWALVRSGARLGQANRYLAPAILAVLLVSSYGAEERMAKVTQYNSGRYYVTNEDPQVGVRLIEGALATVPELLPLDEAHLYLVEGLLIAGQDYQDALDRALLEVPDSPNIRLIADLSDLITTEEGRAVDQRQLDHLFARYTLEKDAFLHMVSILGQHFGNWFSVRGDDALAVRAYDLSLRVDPQNLNTARRLLKVLLTRGLYDEAVATIGRIGRFHQDNPQLLYLEGLSFVFADRLDEALESIRRAQQLEPSAELCVLEGNILSKRGYAEEAMEAYQRAIAFGAATPEPYLLLSYHYRKKGDSAGAIKVLESALIQYPDHAPIHYNLGRYYLDK